MRMFDCIHQGDVRDVVAAEIYSLPPPDYVPLDAQTMPSYPTRI